jgi:secretion/DNA translocation related TadE-like protein
MSTSAPTGRHAPSDRGIATVLAATGIAVIMTALVVGLYLGAAVAARHRAEAAADLAALAAAGVAVQGPRTACDRAAEIAAAMGGTVTSCGLRGWHALVEVEVAVPLALPGTSGATGRARAGPDLPAVADPGSVPPPAPPATGRDRFTISFFSFSGSLGVAKGEAP